MNSDSPQASPAPRPEDWNSSQDPEPSAVDDAAVRLAELLMVKPKWRGWIHTVTAPLALAAGVILVVLAPTVDRRVTSAIYAATGVLLFGVSAVYHRGNWSPRVKLILKRLDHTNIMLVIAGTYTPLAWTLLERQQAVVLLWVIWAGAILGVLFRLLWTDAPRWLYVPIYIALGCGALFYLPQFFQASIPAAVLICVGGVLYITGAVFYALKKPNFSYYHFGFHELFHAFTVFAFAAHFVAIALAVLA
ncbi:hemolysin III family protein [Arthrobacter sp. DNA4]|uniref:PAQR family membrane homeostasis protein TrhA n=1 Tax=Arthrobacter sp. DNA4 TaxID=2963432 RepID=UPI0020CCFF84|nr:hemolysin III family protein [Arthrobacter sp. DNA4]UTT70729.1 hemolysin III family protein [Arthrobacter sp. DNA4]